MKLNIAQHASLATWIKVGIWPDLICRCFFQVTLTRDDAQGGIVVENKADEPAEFVLIAGA